MGCSSLPKLQAPSLPIFRKPTRDDAAAFFRLDTTAVKRAGSNLVTAVPGVPLVAIALSPVLHQSKICHQLCRLRARIRLQDHLRSLGLALALHEVRPG